MWRGYIYFLQSFVVSLNSECFIGLLHVFCWCWLHSFLFLAGSPHNSGKLEKVGLGFRVSGLGFRWIRKKCEVHHLVWLPHALQAVESLDPFHQCLEYWNAKQSQRPDAAEGDIRRLGISVGRLKQEALELPLRPSQDTAQQSRIVNNTNMRHSVNISSAKTAASQAFVQESPLIRQGTVPSQGTTYSTLQGLFQRATPAELRLLYRLFTNDKQGAEWSSAFRALTEEVQRRFLWSGVSTYLSPLNFELWKVR